ncbi:hypothetical protein [Nostoc sp.]|uniref:hypothetical protein n=1 Tax=Nostoc sp. TaxID=1180 RepID=UPI002FF61BE2
MKHQTKYAFFSGIHFSTIGCTNVKQMRTRYVACFDLAVRRLALRTAIYRES